MMGRIYKYVFCFINALIGIFTLKFHYTMLDIFGNNSEVYIDRFKISDILFFVIFFLIWLIIFYIIDRLLRIKSESSECKISSKKLFIISIISLLICWSPYYFSFFPGGVYSDTYVQFNQARYGITGGGYSVFYSLYIRLLHFISFNNNTVTFILMTIIQLLLYIGIISYFIIWLKNKKIPKYMIVVSMIFFCLNPRIPIYALSLWKDSLFSILLFLYSIYVFDIIYSDTKILEKKRNIIYYCALCVLVSLFRNNGFYIVLIVSVALFTRCFKKFKNKKMFSVSAIITLIVIMNVYTILFNILGYNPPYRESVGMQLQQIGYVVSNNDIDHELVEELNKFILLEDIKANYHPMIVDDIKKSSNFNNEYLETHKSDFWLLWLKLMVNYPKQYFIASLYNNVGYWNYFTLCVDAGSDSLMDYYDVTATTLPEEGDISNNIDIIYNLFGFSLKSKIKTIASYLNNCAIGTLLMFIGIYMLIIKKNNKYLIVYFPSIIIFLALIFGTPCAFSSRYIIYTILFIPFGLIIPFLNNKKE